MPVSYGDPPKHVAYGTAGFRDKAVVLPAVLYRVARVAALRSRFLKGKVIGVMITASHNPPADNGAKIVEPLGEMLEQSWEALASDVANAKGVDALNEILSAAYQRLGVDPSSPATVLYGRDSRESGPELEAALEAGLAVEKAGAHSVGLVTTPQLHYLVRALNTLNLPGEESYGVPTTDGYYRKLATAFSKILSIPPNAAAVHGVLPIEVTVDCANGIGAPAVAEMAKLLPSVKFNSVNVDYETPEKLNEDCGADYVKTNQKAPAGVALEPGKLYASFDGDADRVVFYYANSQGEFRLLDGDKIASLVALFLDRLVKDAGAKLRIGVVQTAYANGASTKYLAEKLKVPVVTTPTGVKHLHHAALDFDIGVYFEANGHGTVLFDPESIAQLRTLDVSRADNKDAIDTLLALSDLINQTVGDALSDLLTVLVVVACLRLSPAEWDAEYTDLPNRLFKAGVKDRTIFKTTDAERRLLEPAIQPEIDAIVAKYPLGRSFVRASGTEDVVRVYAEAETQALTDQLGNQVLDLLKQFQ